MTPFLSRCYASRGAEQVELIAAALCADRQEYEVRVIDALKAQGYQFYWSDSVLPAASWVKQYPADAAYAVALARSMNEEKRVALGVMTRLPGSGDATEHDKHWLQIEEIGPITPLDAQFGVYPKKTVPDALREALFGQPDPTDAERADFGDDVPPLVTYAVLDAAKMPYLLTSLLEDSGLRHQSLFQGKAQEELAEHAPYLVELIEDNDFTCRLFTGPDGIGGLWERRLGIFLRSRAGFNTVRKHLRKFTKVQDENGKWFYFRFWDVETMRSFKSHLAVSQEQATAFFSLYIRYFIWCHRQDNRFCRISISQPKIGSGQMVLDEALLRRFGFAARARRIIRFQSKVEALINANDPLVAQKMAEQPKARRFYYVRLIDQMGVRNVSIAAALLSAMYLTGVNLLRHPAFEYATRNRLLTPEAKAQQITLGYSVVAQLNTMKHS
ncbi:hypothetical protein DN062_07070 [Nitrincola tibetensis]|uniref:DUF4123 domain-containing protein n=1 Tax=Nitrincola tibetensis TaxID=2219697 RepID=A0A364NNS3_9GAMM|nr:DUF4123 domain-containing protein [Nitrincola tibetensis]RAU18527.1 hypothetical protein DN062_07070 [Nitrincola tibetensis]